MGLECDLLFGLVGAVGAEEGDWIGIVFVVEVFLHVAQVECGVGAVLAAR
jgi:hypothetical protein